MKKRRSTNGPELPDPSDPDYMTKLLIANSIAIGRMADKLDEIHENEEESHAVVLALREHLTIERVDSLWEKSVEVVSSVRTMKWLVGGVAGVVGFVAVVVGIAYTAHQIWGWP